MEIKGRIFDIQRFSVHDGPGIRTTVFMKGCSLRCPWCHNPEGLDYSPTASFEPDECLGCGECRGEHTPENIKKCPVGAILPRWRDIEARDLVAELIRDRDFFGQDGGVTFSGGECLLQADFLCEALKLLKEEGINTAIDTSGAVPFSAFEKTLPYADLYVTATGNCHIITLEHMKKMKDQAIICNIGHFDNEIEVAELENCPGVVKTEFKGSECPVSYYTFPDGHRIYLLAEGRLVNLGCATGHPSFVMSNSFTNQVLAQLDICRWQKRQPGVYLIDKTLDEEVARLHLDKLGAKLSTLTQEQADYIGVPVEGPFKGEHYRY